ncbi:cytochrome p450 isoform A [Chlorella sorokiniana]|uniref:Cytochrome p450 isoform A n=1 Tax=Chlorella sorokiniana TaxID=3076 RepID=A0A2P6TF78_CHLSO|nr:cytochrome p450 isoform A [Chlorella sorokiniana]|eukprot:PRW32625.1 cytochrome p450 isoform A [Chlorella sorokiniana]
MRTDGHCYGDLTALTSLTRLTLGSNLALPACLGTMSWLRALHITSTPHSPANYDEPGPGPAAHGLHQRTAGMAGRAQAVQWGSLPDELWLKVFGGVDFAERHRSLALVCRYWAQLVHTPALLTEVQLTQEGSQAVVPCLRSFCAWLPRRAAGHVRRLRFCISLDRHTDQREVVPTLAAATAACCAAGGLQDLYISVESDEPMQLSWLAALTSLTRLEFDRELTCPLEICGSLEHLTNLRELVLGGAPIQRWEPGTRLPPSLTHLLRAASWPAYGLRGMTWLRHLEMCNTPDCVNNRHWDEDEQLLWPEVVFGAIGQLSRLTHLELEELAYFPLWPGCFADFRELRTLASETMYERSMLPGGAYLHTLRRLVIPAVQWGSLPDELWVKVFGGIDFAERHRSLALVCRRWAQLVLSPALLEDVRCLNVPRSKDDVRTFCTWVLRRALPHVRRLFLRLDHEPDTSADPLATAAATAAACCAAGVLEDLSMHVSEGSLELGWVAALTSLRRLNIDTENACQICVLGSMRHLTRMQELSLDGSPVFDWAEGAHLPPSLTFLSLRNTVETVTLHQLTWLQRLELRDTPDSDADNVLYGIEDQLLAKLQAALAPLTGLTHLVLDALDYLRNWPAAVTSMTALHSLLGWDLPPGAQLPPGAYLRGLRRLALPAHAAGLSLAALAGAEQLQELELSWPGIDGPAAVQWGSLPDELWIKVFGGVGFAERHRSLALVCRRWAELVHTPDLLTNVQLTTKQSQAVIPCLRSFCAWLARRAAGHVQRLCLRFNLGRVQHDGEFLGLLVAATTACSTAGQLHDLTLHISSHPSSLPLSWVAALTSLRRLEIDPNFSTAVDVCGSLHHLTNLQELVLAGAPIQEWESATRLPPSITRLQLDGTGENVSLHQLASLSRLEQLMMLDVCAPSSSYACLRQLSRMTKLSLIACDNLPHSLGELTWLRHLEMMNTPSVPPGDMDWSLEGAEAWPDQLQEALTPLTGLAHLRLYELKYFPYWPAAIAGMAELHTLAAEMVEPDALLPAGPYLRSLRHLHLPVYAPWNMAAAINSNSTGPAENGAGGGSKCVAVVHAFYAAINRGDGDALGAVLAEDVEWDCFELPTSAQKIVAQGDTVFTTSDTLIACKATGKQARMEGAYLFQFNEEGLIRVFKHFVDTGAHVWAVDTTAARLRRQLEPPPPGFPPGPAGDVAVGMLQAPLPFLEELRRQHGTVVGLLLGGERVVLVAEPEAARAVLIDPGQPVFVKAGTAFFPGSSLTGNGLLTSDGEVWKRQRRLANPAFRRAAIDKYGQAMLRCADDMALRRWRDGTVRDVYAEFNRLTLRVTLEALFGARLAAGDESAGREITDSIQAAFRFFAQRGATAMVIPEFVPTPDNVQFNAAVQRLDRAIYGLIAERRSELEASPRPPQDLLDSLLLASDDDGQGMADQALRDELLTLLVAGQETSAILLGWACAYLAHHPEAQQAAAAEVDALLRCDSSGDGSSGDGSSSSSSSFSWGAGGRQLEVADAGRLPMVEAVILEAMRLAPPAYLMGRCAAEDTQLAGYNLPKGTTVLVCPHLLHRDLTWWGPDAAVFRPERWLELQQMQQAQQAQQAQQGQQSASASISISSSGSSGASGGGCPHAAAQATTAGQQAAGSSSESGSSGSAGTSGRSGGPSGGMTFLTNGGPNGAYLPFGAGQRNCIGTGFAMMEAVLVLAAVLRSWRLEPLPGAKFPAAQPQITLRPAEVRLLLRRRLWQDARQSRPSLTARAGGGGSGGPEPSALQQAVTSPLYRIWLQLGVVLLLLMLVDAGFSGDWSRIGAISTDQEAALRQVAAYVGCFHLLCGAAAAAVSSRRGEQQWPARTAKVLAVGGLALLEVLLLPEGAER